MRTLITILVVLQLSTGAVWADESLGAAAKRYGYDAAAVARIESILDDAKAAGLSTEPLRNKAVEGMAKHVAADRLIEAVKQQKARMAALRSAAPALAKSPAAERAGLTALAGGLSPETVAAVTSRTKDESRVQAALYAAGLLKAAGIDENSAAKFVGTQIEAGLRAAEIDEISRTSARAARAGLVTGGDLATMQPADLQGDRRAKFLEAARGFDGRQGGQDRARAPRDAGTDRAAETDRIRADRAAAERRNAEKPGGTVVDRPGDDDHSDDDHDEEPELERDRRK